MHGAHPHHHSTPTAAGPARWQRQPQRGGCEEDPELRCVWSLWAARAREPSTSHAPRAVAHARHLAPLRTEWQWEPSPTAAACQHPLRQQRAPSTIARRRRGRRHPCLRHSESPKHAAEHLRLRRALGLVHRHACTHACTHAACSAEPTRPLPSTLSPAPPSPHPQWVWRPTPRT